MKNTKKKAAAAKEPKSGSKPKIEKKDKTAAAEKPESEVPAKRTIKQLVIEILSATPSATTEEMIGAIKTEFPGSAFNAKHASWYRWQAKKGALTGTPLAVSAK
jgi:hypothetical protein